MKDNCGASPNRIHDTIQRSQFFPAGCVIFFVFSRKAWVIGNAESIFNVEEKPKGRIPWNPTLAHRTRKDGHPAVKRTRSLIFLYFREKIEIRSRCFFSSPPGH